MEFAIEGYDPQNFGDVQMVSASIKLADTALPRSRFVLPRQISLSPALNADVRLSISFAAPSIGGRRYTFFGPRKRLKSFRISEQMLAARGRIVLYCCGYLFGDYWPASWIQEIATDFAKVRRNGNRIILMPQSFGPFENHDVAGATVEALQSAEIVQARDDQSYNFVREISPSLKVVQAADYTGFLNNPNDQARIENRVCVIPNVKIIEKGGSQRKDAYFDCVFRACEAISSTASSSVAILRHTTHADDNLAEQLALFLEPLKPKLVDPLPCYGAREFICNSRYVLASRFHALASALAQGVPSLAIGWTHKYDGILRQYSQERYLLQLDRGGWDGIIFDFLAKEKENRATLREQHAAMLETVYPAIMSRFRSVTLPADARSGRN